MKLSNWTENCWHSSTAGCICIHLQTTAPIGCVINSHNNWCPIHTTVLNFAKLSGFVSCSRLPDTEYLRLWHPIGHWWRPVSRLQIDNAFVPFNCYKLPTLTMYSFRINFNIIFHSSGPSLSASSLPTNPLYSFSVFHELHSCRPSQFCLLFTEITGPIPEQYKTLSSTWWIFCTFPLVCFKIKYPSTPCFET